jgi:hypothetical protein
LEPIRQEAEEARANLSSDSRIKKRGAMMERVIAIAHIPKHQLIVTMHQGRLAAHSASVKGQMYQHLARMESPKVHRQ